MKSSRTVLTLVAVLILTSCASLMPSGGQEKPYQVAGKVKTLAELETHISTVSAKRVSIPTKLLKSLLANQRAIETHCKNVSGKLDAIRSIDLEEGN